MIIPVVIAALALGRSFDLRSMTTTSYFIYDQSSVAKTKQSIPMTYTTSHYRVLKSSSDANDFLNINGELLLKAKRAQVDLQGYGDYFIKSVNRENTVELLITVYHETVTETFPSYAKLRTDWKARKPSEIGTHYIRSLTYGGRLTISYKMVAKKSEDIETIKAAVMGAINTDGRLDAKVAGDLERLDKDIGSKYTLDIQAYATTKGPINVSMNLKDILKLIDNYPASVKSLNNGKGSPLKLDLVPLKTIDSRFKEHNINGAVESIINEAINKYDDMNVATREFKAWEGKALWNDEQQEKIDEYKRSLKNAYKEMIHAISHLDLSEEADMHHFDDAFEAYGIGKKNIPNKYTRELIKLQHEVENLPYQWYPYTAAVTHYVHWGSVNCTLPSPEPLYIGFAASTPEGYGNGGNLQCLDVEPQLEEKELSKETNVSYLTGLTYQTPEFNKGFVYCSFCRLENATSVITISGRKDCPEEMKFEYMGFLATNNKGISQLICLDGDPDDKRVDLHARNDVGAGRLVPVWNKCETCDKDEVNKYVPCAVCSR